MQPTLAIEPGPDLTLKLGYVRKRHIKRLPKVGGCSNQLSRYCLRHHKNRIRRKVYRRLGYHNDRSCELVGEKGSIFLNALSTHARTVN